MSDHKYNFEMEEMYKIRGDELLALLCITREDCKDQAKIVMEHIYQRAYPGPVRYCSKCGTAMLPLWNLSSPTPVCYICPKGHKGVVEEDGKRDSATSH